MSKSPTDSSDRIPTYEESIAGSYSHTRPPLPPHTSSSSSREKFSSAPSSMTSRIRQERSRRIQHLVTDTIIPCFSTHLSHVCTKLTLVVVPSDSLESCSAPVSAQNVVTPTIQPHETSATVLSLSGPENSASFWTQQAVVTELDGVLQRELAGSADTEPYPGGTVVDTQGTTTVQPRPRSSESAPLPPRSPKKSWLKRTFVLPGPDHDPTGDTGKWDLGWRSVEPSSEPETQARTRTRTRTLKAGDVAVHARWQDVSFRTESQMGLLETSTVKCIWVEIEIGV
ncbi:uncharacterized protein Z518_09050 [Rhinocladiella mackenziei CBS 650.93]|uniref:Rhinocladiella mackenziei CBS 650.93 unplaced genomic scaffold supercont1.7, whole genome shotgun sequence n=1 Tax=Rhinocladiella mackenziei CBS 650.93 TaxID=1442369 RepID=A0A0D2IXK2_9EURO|nr:uncharacterized protein Z518_09050 [Rhinocladiella mackenziei CBS 650.93]KIX01325.1 hypothetical protein Z518_09050 [Rhinocladiella mackenziei CBS 650.93]